MNSIAHQSPIVREIVWRIIEKGDIRVTGEKHRIDSDSIPHLPQHIHIQRNFQESILRNVQNDSTAMHHTMKPIMRPHPIQQNQQIFSGYGKLAALINDPSVSHINCKGPGTQIIVVKRGREQITTISLTQEEINLILKFVSERARIPLTEGIFKVGVDNMLFFAVITKEAGSTLMIKKNFQISTDMREAFQQ